ncbi:MAG: hypothetical protein R3324_01245 [Halobacteriales archaeon]|nr:hypothetical protein [Halobacteriales archaeon]
MWRYFPLLVLMCALAATESPIFGETGTPEPTPAATLLLPYFELHEELDPDGRRTVFTIGNVRPEPVLTNVTLWTNRSVPTIRFNVYLGGYDLQTIDLRELFQGTVPITGETVHPAGALSLQNVAFPGCSDPVAEDLTSEEVAHLQAAHSGQPSETFGGLCAGTSTGGSYTGYVTIDAVERCSTDVPYPSSDGYFEDPDRVASDRNVLWGDYQHLDPANDLAVGDPLVHLEADAINPETIVDGQYTFYARYVGSSAVDHREPLSTNWWVPFEEAFETTSSLVVWRDAPGSAAPFECGSTPDPFPLDEGAVVFFDGAGGGSPAANQLLFPDESQLVPVRGITGTRKGTAFLNLNATDPVAEESTQSWVTVLRSYDGRFWVGHSGVGRVSATNADVEGEP